MKSTFTMMRTMRMKGATTTHRAMASVFTVAHGCYSHCTDGQRTGLGGTEEEAKGPTDNEQYTINYQDTILRVREQLI